MHDKFRDFNGHDFLFGIIFTANDLMRDEGIMCRNHAPDIRECTFQNKHFHWCPQRQIRNHRTSKRLSITDDMFRQNSPRDQIAISRIDIPVKPLFGRPPLTFSITTIIKNKNIQLQLMKENQLFDPVADISRISVTEQDGLLGTRRRNEPSVQFVMISRFKKDIFEQKAMG